MTYNYQFMPSCVKTINKFTKKNPLLRVALEKKVREIVEFPTHYKPLRYDLGGEFRIHLLKHFVLRFTVNHSERRVVFVHFAHHDYSYC